MPQMLDKVPQPLLNDIITGRCIPIIGAGFSLNAITKLDKKMPLWEDLGKKIASMIPDYQYSTPLDSLSAYSHEYTRVNLIERLSELLQIDSTQPGRVHKAFCMLPFDVVCTTNFDFLLERAYDSKPFKYYRTVVNQEQLSLLNSKGVSLIKLHGDLEHPDRLVITEDDYDTFIDKYPILATYLANLLITRTPLFIGYSLDDPDFRQIWQVIGNRLGKMRRPAYVLTAGKNPSKQARYERRGVKAVNLSADYKKYEMSLLSFFEELNNYWLSKTIEKSNFTDEEIWSDISMSKENANRLCFFALSSELLPFYKSAVFPIVNDLGLVPLTENNIISSANSTYASIKALLNRATIIVADETTNLVLSEISMLLQKKENPPYVLIVRSEETGAQKLIENAEEITRPEDLMNNPDNFLKEIGSFFKKKSEKLFNNYSNEPQHLLKMKEYKFALISSISTLEIVLRKSLEKCCDSKSRFSSILYSLDSALKLNIIDEKDYSYLRKVLQIRNRLVHSAGTISSSEAQEMVNEVLIIIDKIEKYSNE